jgi:predicted dehydrogenase
MARDVWTKAFGIESRPPWFVDRSRGGGMWLMNGAHMIDRCCWVLGSGVAAVRGWVGNPIHNAAADDASVAYLHLKNGLTVSLFHAGFKQRGNDQCGVEIVLTDGMVEFDSYSNRLQVAGNGSYEARPIERANPFVVEFARMVDSITTGAPLAVPTAWARHIVAVMLAVEESGRLGREVIIPESDYADPE